MKIGLPGILTILFIALKLTGVIAWSWLWVLSPLWITALLIAIVIGLALFSEYCAKKAAFWNSKSK